MPHTEKSADGSWSFTGLEESQTYQQLNSLYQPDWAQAHTLNNSIKQPLVTGQMDRHREGEQYKSEIVLKI